MKKLVLSIFAVAALASCFQNEELVGAGNNTAIEFADAYVGGVTKAIDGSYSNTNMFDKFQVYGTLENNGVVANIFGGVDVMKGGAGWYYDDAYTTYWISGNTYNFKAVVAGNEAGETAVAVDANGMPTTITLSDASAQNDILYAEKLDINYTGNAEPVRFVFEHLLAKAKVSVRNIIPVDNGGYYVVKDVKLTKAIESATYTIDTESWANHAGEYVLEFGHIVAANETAAGANAIELGYEGKGSSNYERLIVPQANCPLTISINYAYYDRNGAEHLSPVVKEISTVANIEAGKAYNFVLTLAEPGEKIEFDVQDVTDWEEELPVYEGTTVYVADAAELTAAINNPDVAAVVLTEDVTLDSTITRAEGAGVTIAKSFTIDGNGNTLTYTGSGRAIDIKSDVENETYKNVTIKNLTINCSASYCERGINYNANGSLILDNVKVGGQSVSYALNFPGKADNATVQIIKSELTGLIALNVWGEDMEIYVTNSILTSVENNTVENYAAVSLNADASNIADGTVVNIKGGKVIANDENGAPAIAVRNATSTGVVNISESTEVVGIVTNPVAAVYYNGTTNSYLLPTLQAAIDKAIESNAAGVSLLKDVVLEETLVIPAGKPVVLDLNGHTISQEKSCTASYEMIANNGELTIMGNGKISFKDTSAGDPTHGWGSYTIRNSGTLVVEDGVIEHLGNQAFATHMICAIFQYSGSTTINGGVISTPNYRSARLWKGSMTINGGEFNGQLWVQAVDNSSELTVNGGSFAPVGRDGSSIFVTNNDYTVNLAVNGGYFNTKIGTSVPSKDGVKGAIKGGSFTESAKENTNAALLAAGYSFVEENGVWSVVKASFVSTQQALKDAIAANEETIYVSGQIDLTEEILGNFGGTIIGVDNTACLNTRTFTVLSADEAYHLGNKTVNFKDITIKVPAEDGDFLKTGFVAGGTMNFDNCVFEGQVTLNGAATWTFNKCEFGGADNGAYASFVYGVKKVTFNECSFSGVDRAAKVYGTGSTIEAEYNNCTFTSTTSNKYAVNIDASYSPTKVVLNGCSQTGTPGLYAVTGAKATVWVDGVQQ